LHNNLKSRGCFCGGFVTLRAHEHGQRDEIVTSEICKTCIDERSQGSGSIAFAKSRFESERLDDQYFGWCENVHPQEVLNILGNIQFEEALCEKENVRQLYFWAKIAVQPENPTAIQISRGCEELEFSTHERAHCCDITLICSKAPRRRLKNWEDLREDLDRAFGIASRNSNELASENDKLITS
jgi:hypothetical protein